MPAHHKRVYDDFARLSRERAVQAAAGGGGAGQGGLTEQALRAFESSSGSGSVVGAGGAAAPADHMRLVLEKCMASVNKAEELVLRSPQLAAGKLLSLPQGHELTQLIIQCRALVAAQPPAAREEVAVLFGQKVFRRMYDASKFGRCPLGVDWLLAMLVALNDMTKRVSKEVRSCLIASCLWNGCSSSTAHMLMC